MVPPNSTLAPVASAAPAAAGWAAAKAPVLELKRWNPTWATVPATDDAVAPETDPSSMVYEVDWEGRIVHVSDGWDLFALANGAPELRRRAVLGRSLWTSIADEHTAAEHKAILDRCRARMQVGTYLFRCDAPFERRMLRMRIDPLEDGGFRFESHTIAVQPRSGRLYEAVMRLSPAPDVARCSHCNRFRFGREWLEAEHVVQVELDDDAEPVRSRMIHTLCPECRAAMRNVPRLVPTPA